MKIKFEDIEEAYNFVSSCQPFMHFAIISKSTGKTYYRSEMYDDYDEMPEDIEENDDYVVIPHKNDLDLGKRLVFAFVNNEIPELYDKVQSIFSRKGAYGRYKELLSEIDLLDKWYEFENSETKKALYEWCEDNKLKIIG
jgi:hypothetical protein